MAVIEISETVIVVDSSTWVDFFNDNPSAYVNRLQTALMEEEDIAVVPIVVTEVLQGFRSAEDFDRARNVLTGLPFLEPNVACHVRAASLYTRLRSKGVTVRGAVDCVIAQVCIESGSTLLSPDSDFRFIAEHSGLKLWSPAGM